MLAVRDDEHDVGDDKSRRRLLRVCGGGSHADELRTERNPTGTVSELQIGRRVATN
jgi:hypothetical protein